MGVYQKDRARARHERTLELSDRSGASTLHTFLYQLVELVNEEVFSQYFNLGFSYDLVWLRMILCHTVYSIMPNTSPYRQVLSSFVVLCFWLATIWIALRLRTELVFSFYMGMSSLMSVFYLMLGVLNGGYAKLHSAQNDPAAFRAIVAFSTLLFVFNVQFI